MGIEARLAMSSAATSARWSTGRPSASRSSSCARFVMGSFYTRALQPNNALEPSRPPLASEVLPGRAAQRER